MKASIKPGALRVPKFCFLNIILYEQKLEILKELADSRNATINLGYLLGPQSMMLLLLFSCQVMFYCFATPWIVAHQIPPSMGFPRQGYWSGLPFPSVGYLADSVKRTWDLTCGGFRWPDLGQFLHDKWEKANKWNILNWFFLKVQIEEKKKYYI